MYTEHVIISDAILCIKTHDSVVVCECVTDKCVLYKSQENAVFVYS